jgi:hypothetical protein
MKNESLKKIINNESVPYQETNKLNYRRRIFSSLVEEIELKWHVDMEDRDVTVIKSNNWFLQMDNGLPLKLIEGYEYHIPKNIYHRVIKGDGDLIINLRLANDI